MSLVTNSFVSTATSDVKLTVKTGTSQQADFTIEHVDYTALLQAADDAADAAILEYDGAAQEGNGDGTEGNAAAIAADTTMATTLAAAIAAATAAGLTTLAAALSADDHASDKSVANAALDAAILSGGAIGAALAADTTAAITQLAEGDLLDGNYRIAYSDAIGAVNYAAANNVQVIQFSMVGGAMVGTHAKLSNVKTDLSTIVTTATKITGTITFGTGTGSDSIDGTGYGMQFTHVNSSSSASVGTGSGAGRVIVNGGPVAMSDDFRVNLTPVDGETDKATVEFKLATGTVANHTTGKHTDIKWLRFMWADAITCVFQTEDIDIKTGTTIYDGGNKLLISREVDFGSAVATTLFEYSAALVDTAGAVSTYASTAFASSVADNATNVENIAISGDSYAGTEIKVNWTAPSFTAKTIVGYEIVTQKLAAGTAATNGLSGADEKFICDIAHGSNNTTDIVVAALAYQTDSTTIFEKTLTSLTERAKYAVWVRAYHASVNSVRVYGSIGLDKMNAPAYVWDTDAADLAFDATLHSWAGSYLEDAVSATPTTTGENTTTVALFNKSTAYATATGLKKGVTSTLTGRPSDFSSSGTSIVVLNGNSLQKGGVAATATGDAIMSSSIAIKWQDKDISFQGMADTNREMQYMCFKKSEYDLADTNSYLSDYYAGTLVSSGTSYYSSGWTMMVNADISGATGAIGTGELTGATYGVAAMDSSTRYCRFSNTVTADDGDLATFDDADGEDGAVSSAANPTLRKPVLTSFTVNTDDALTAVTSAAGDLALGEEYVFVLRLKNANGTNTPKKFSAKMVQGRASAAAFRGEAGTGLAGATSLMWNPTTNKFEFRISDQNKSDLNAIATLPIPTGARPTDMSYDVTITTGSQNDARDGTNGYTSNTETHTITTDKAIACASSIDATTGVTTVSFSQVYAKVNTYTLVGSTTGKTQGEEALVDLSALYGYTFVMKLIAKNANGSLTTAAVSGGAAATGTVAYSTARQVFAPEATFTAFTTDAAIATAADTVSSGVTTTYNDVREQAVADFQTLAEYTADVGVQNTQGTVSTTILNIAADIKDLTSANFDTVGRIVDKIRYEIYQTLSDGSTYIVPGGSGDVSPTSRITVASDGAESTSTAAGDKSMGLYMAYSQPIHTNTTSSADLTSGSTYAAGTITNAVANRFNVWVRKQDTKKGYALKMKVSLVSDDVADLAQHPAKSTLALSAVEFDTSVKLLTYTTKPFENHDEVQHMTYIAGDEEMTIYWSAPNMAADELQGVSVQDVPSLEGYQIELYDIVTRSPATGKTFKTSQGLTSTILATDALNIPAKTITNTTLTKLLTEYKITGLKNGKHYVPVIRTVTKQGGADVLSVGRTLFANMGTSSAEYTRHSVDVLYADDSVAYAAARWKLSSSAATDKTSVVLNAGSTNTTTVIPYGSPKIVVSLTATPPTLKVDSNGRELLFGAMLQTAPGGTNATPADSSAARLGSADLVADADANVFYLDLSFNASAQSGFTGASSFDAPTLAIYVSSDTTASTGDAGTAYPGRTVTNVNTAYLGANWTSETNFIFASNAAGTTVGKIATASTAGAVAAYSGL